VPRAAKPFFIPVVHTPSGAVGHMATPVLPSQEGRARSRGTRGSTGAHLSKEVRSRAEGRLAVPELASAKRRGPGSWDTWQRQSSPQQGGEIRDRGTRDSTGAHLIKEARSRAEGHVAAPELTSARRRGSGPRDTWWRWSPPLQGGIVRSYSLRGNVWMYALLLVLT
jgi:hypothetical protein